jgi:hypothetical protein
MCRQNNILIEFFFNIIQINIFKHDEFSNFVHHEDSYETDQTQDHLSLFQIKACLVQQVLEDLKRM